MANRPIDTSHARQQQIAGIRQLIVQGRLADAMKQLVPMTKTNSRDADAWALRAMVAERVDNTREMALCAHRSVDIHPSPHGLVALATALGKLGQTDEALSCCARATELAPDQIAIELQRGQLLEEAGRIEEAATVIEPIRTQMMEQGDDLVAMAHYEWAKILLHRGDLDAAMTVIDDDLLPATTRDDQRSQALFLRAKVCDRAGHYDDAWDSATQANSIGKSKYGPDGHAGQVTSLMNRWSPALIDRFPVSTCPSEVPVFIAGMPRSGTSLVDQIIDAHPQGAGVGELDSIQHFARQLGQAYDVSKLPPECFGPYQSPELTRAANQYIAQVSALAPREAQRIVNKALGNERLIGLLSRLFPCTRIIHTRRDPRDVAVSCYLGGFNNRTFSWTTKLEWSAHAQRQSTRMMQFWSDTLDIPMMDVRYEDLVQSPETEMPRLIEFIGLDWNDACTTFHESRRTVRTLSYDQVNKPLYSTSIDRWKHYESHLQGVDWPDS